MSPPKVLIGGVFLEAHSFAHLRSGAESFVITEGEDLLRKLETSGSLLGGGARALTAAGAQLIPTFQAVAPPGGLADHDLYLSFRDRMEAAVHETRPDAIFLELHGAMGTSETDDAEGDLVACLRAAAGADTPIAAGLDMHACVTRRMLEATPLWIACKENPHTDYPEAGARAAELLLKTLDGRLAPVASAIWLPLLLRGRLNTGDGPLAELHALRSALEAMEGVEDISIYNAYPYLDCAEAGQCLTVLSDGEVPAAREALLRLAHQLWATREAYEPDRPSAEAVLEETRAREPPVILGDFGDRVLGGSAGDGTYLLHLLRTRPDLSALVPVTDPEIVRRALAAGEGAVLTAAVGGGFTPGEAPLEAQWTVRRMGDGRFVQQGPFLAHEPADMGPCAVLASGSLVILASSKPALSQDPACFLSQGEDPANFSVVVCKSGVHFAPAFAAYGRTVAVETPGLTNYVPGRFPFRRRPAYWPEDPAVRPDFVVHSYRGANRAPLRNPESPHA